MSHFSPEEFVNKKVKILFEPMVTQILVDKPKDPVKNNKLINYFLKF
jgi:hypothetical protein